MSESATRPYRKKKRARQQEETRRRITEAVMELHRTVGPANTTITEVAELAEVSRMTVYNHFPTEGELIEACASHWSARHPYPDPGPWIEIGDARKRLPVALTELYRWYRGTEDMMGKILRDAPLVPALDEIVEASWRAHVDRMVEVLAAGRDAGKDDPETLFATLRWVVDFFSWRTLTGAGLDDETAATIASRSVEAAV